MSYLEWFEKHAKKHQEIMRGLEDLSDDEVIEYFDFENMVINEPDFCPLYKKNKKCHDVEELNCYLCACPNFRFDDEGFEIVDGRVLKSYCAIDSKDGDQFKSDSVIHQNCTGCKVPHSKSYVKAHFKRDWLEIMKESPSKKEFKAL